MLNTRGKQAFFLSIFLALLMAFVVFVVLFALAQSELNDSHDANAQYGKARPNVVFFIADGFGPESATYIRTMTESRTIPLDDIISGSVQTFSADNRITDSAAGATAYSCTKKTLNDAVGVLPDMTPCGTLMEAAKLSGHWKTGVVTTARITHATPAAWTAHVGHRDQEEEIALQQATDQHVDLLFGGGLKFFVNRSDSQDLFQVMRDRGYTTASNYSQFLGLDHHDLPLIGLFAPDHIAYEIDRVRENPISQPSLLQMTQKALELLTADTSKPFFLMVEAGKIDLAEHVHDAAAEYWELQQYMETIKLVQNFVSSHPNTIVIAVADHETGGISLGAEKTPYQYPEPYAWEPSVISAVTASSEAMSFMIRGGQDIRSVFSQYANINDVTDLEVASVQAAIDIGKTTFWISTAISDIVAVRAKIGWTTPGHTGGDINLHTFGRKISGLQGNVQNIRVGELLMHALGLGPYVQDVTQELQDMYSPTRPAHKVATSQPREYWSHN